MPSTSSVNPQVIWRLFTSFRALILVFMQLTLFLALGSIPGSSPRRIGVVVDAWLLSMFRAAWSMSSEPGRGPLVVRILRGLTFALVKQCPRQDSNLRHRL